MARVRLSTTVDSELLGGARELRAGVNDAGLIDEALAALLAQHRAATIDHAYAAAYDAQPIGVADEWGDLESFREAAAAAT
jgi:post-segregation antitoxin (ccd killing protein)